MMAKPRLHKTFFFTNPSIWIFLAVGSCLITCVPDKRRYRPCGFQVSGNATYRDLGQNAVIGKVKFAVFSR
jgi:hypothetical protein